MENHVLGFFMKNILFYIYLGIVKYTYVYTIFFIKIPMHDFPCSFRRWSFSVRQGGRQKMVVFGGVGYWEGLVPKNWNWGGTGSKNDAFKSFLTSSLSNYGHALYEFFYQHLFGSSTGSFTEVDTFWGKKFSKDFVYFYPLP